MPRNLDDSQSSRNSDAALSVDNNDIIRIFMNIMMRYHLDITQSSWHIRDMRTTLTIDDDLLAAAKSLASARSESVGRVLSDLARRGLSADLRVSREHEGSFPVFDIGPGAHPITIEDVRRLEDEG